MRVFFLYSVLLFLSCSQNKPQEDYDIVTVTEYENLYDIIGRLSKVHIKVTIEAPHHRNENNEAFVTTYYGLRQYEYKTDSEYTMRESFASSGESRIVRYSDKKKEELRLKNGDTITYTFDRYYDEDKIEYSRMKWKDSGEISMAGNYETYYFYDKNGNNIKRIETDLQTGESKQELITVLKQIRQDTVITRKIVNDALQSVEKEFVNEKKKVRKVEQILDNSVEFVDVYIESVENGIKVDVNKSISKYACVIDSVYSKGDIKIKSVKIDSSKDMEMITTSEYDSKGNIVKEIMKTKHKVQ